MKIPAYAMDGNAYFLSRLTAGAYGTKSGKSGDSQQSTRLDSLREVLDRLKAMPTSLKQAAKQGVANKVGFLQRRLALLKQLLMHASPAQAKTLLRELKSIAGELAALARTAGGGGGGGQSSLPTPTLLNAATSNQAKADGSTQAQDASAADGAEATPDADPKPETTGAQQSGAAAPAGKEADSADTDDGALKSALQETRKLLKEVIALMKGKLAAAGKKAHDDLREAERSLSDLSRSLDSGGTANLYTTLGSLAGVGGGLGGATASGTNVSAAA